MVYRTFSAVHFNINPFSCSYEGGKKALMVSNLAPLLVVFRLTARQAWQTKLYTKTGTPGRLTRQRWTGQRDRDRQRRAGQRQMDKYKWTGQRHMDRSKTDRHRWTDRRDTDRQTDGQITEEKRKTEMDSLERDRQR